MSVEHGCATFFSCFTNCKIWIWGLGFRIQVLMLKFFVFEFLTSNALEFIFNTKHASDLGVFAFSNRILAESTAFSNPKSRIFTAFSSFGLQPCLLLFLSLLLLLQNSLFTSTYAHFSEVRALVRFYVFSETCEASYNVILNERKRVKNLASTVKWVWV